MSSVNLGALVAVQTGDISENNPVQDQSESIETQVFTATSRPKTALQKAAGLFHLVVLSAAPLALYGIWTGGVGISFYAARFILILAIRKIFASTIGYLVFSSTLYSRTRLRREGEERMQGLIDEGYQVKKVTLIKSGLTFTGIAVSHPHANPGNWTLRAVDDGEHIERELRKAGSDQVVGFNTFFLNGPGIGENQGLPTPENAGSIFDAGLQYLESMETVRRIRMVGFGRGTGFIGEGVIAHDFEPGMKKGIFYQAEMDRGSDRLSNEIAERLWLIKPLVKGILFILGIEMDGIKAAKKLHALGIKQIVVNCDGNDGRIRARASLAYGLRREGIYPAGSTDIITDPGITHSQLPHHIHPKLRRKIKDFADPAKSMIAYLNSERPSFENLMEVITKATADMRIAVQENRRSPTKKTYSIYEKAVGTPDEDVDPTRPAIGTTTLANIIATNELNFTPEQMSALFYKLMEVNADFEAIDRTLYLGMSDFRDIHNTPLRSLIAASAGNTQYDEIIKTFIHYISTLPADIKSCIIDNAIDNYKGNHNEVGMSPAYYLIRVGKEDLALQLFNIGASVQCDMDGTKINNTTGLSSNPEQFIASDLLCLALASFGTSQEKVPGKCIKAIFKRIREQKVKLHPNNKKTYIEALTQFTLIDQGRGKEQISRYLVAKLKEWGEMPEIPEGCDLYWAIRIYYRDQTLPTSKKPLASREHIPMNPRDEENFKSMCRKYGDKLASGEQLNESETHTLDQIVKALAEYRTLYGLGRDFFTRQFSDEYRTRAGEEEKSYSLIKWTKLLDDNHQVVMLEILAELESIYREQSIEESQQM